MLTPHTSHGLAEIGCRSYRRRVLRNTTLIRHLKTICTLILNSNFHNISGQSGIGVASFGRPLYFWLRVFLNRGITQHQPFRSCFCIIFRCLPRATWHLFFIGLYFSIFFSQVFGGGVHSSSSENRILQSITWGYCAVWYRIFKAFFGRKNISHRDGKTSPQASQLLRNHPTIAPHLCCTIILIRYIWYVNTPIIRTRRVMWDFSLGSKWIRAVYIFCQLRLWVRYGVPQLRRKSLYHKI